MGHAAVHRHAELRDVGELQRVVLAGPDRLGEVAPHLAGVDVECRAELDVAHLVVTQVDVHETGHRLRRIGVAIELDALHERRGAVAHADDRDPNLVALVTGRAVGGCVRVHPAVGLAH
jgi:hypothetical protein